MSFDRSKIVVDYVSLLIFLIAAWAPQIADAAVPQSKAKQLGKSLTALGANPKGNAAGTIPAIGEQAPANASRSKPLYTISSENLAQHRGQLTPGQVALFQMPDFRMEVYPSVRQPCYPEKIETATIKNATSATLTRDTKSPRNVRRGVPFPLPQSGLEAIFNHLMAPQPTTTAVKENGVGVKGNEHYKSSRHRISRQSVSKGSLTNYSMTFPGQYRKKSRRNVKFLNFTYFEKMDSSNPGSSSSMPTYSFGNKVRRGHFNSNYSASFYQIKSDSFNIYRGPPYQYDWSLDRDTQEVMLGYGAEQNSSSAADMVSASSSVRFPNPADLHYELHRAHRLEATLKIGQKKRNVYARRVLYLDEDSWTAVSADLYDSRGELWRTHQGFLGRHLSRSGDTWCLLTNDVSYDVNYPSDSWYSPYHLITRDISVDSANVADKDFVPFKLKSAEVADFLK